MKLLAAPAIAVILLAAAGPQTPSRDVPRVAASGSAAVSGVVVSDDETRAPVRRATLILTRAGVSDRRVISSDDRGLFLFEDLPGGVYTLSASKGGFLPASYGAAKAGLPAAPIPVADGQRVALAPLALTSGSVITGRITDDVGLPVADAAVYAAQYEISNGVRRRRNLPAGPIRVTTNAHGDYRIFGVSAGDYLVGAVAANAPLGGTVVTAAELQWAQRQSQAAGSAGPQPAAPGAATPDVSPAAGRAFGDAMTYFPGTVDIGAAAIVSLGRAQERGGLDFRLQKLPLARVRGIVVGPDGQPVPSATLIRSPKAESIVPSSGGFAERGMADGTFVVRGGVPPGEHIVSVRSAARPASTTQAVLWGRAELNIHGEDVTDLTIQLQPTVALSGVLVFEGTSPVPSSLGGVRLRLTASPETPVPFGSFVGSVQPDRSFKIPSLEPAHYRMTITVPSLLSGATEWVVKSAVLGGRDILDAAIDVRPGEDLTGVVVTLSDRHTELSGTLTDSAGQPTPQFYLLAFATDRDRWTQDSRWIKLVRADGKGGYRITGLPAGEYYVAALTELDPSQEYEPVFLEQLVPASLKITLTDGAPRTQTLRVGGSK